VARAVAGVRNPASPPRQREHATLGSLKRVRRVTAEAAAGGGVQVQVDVMAWSPASAHWRTLVGDVEREATAAARAALAAAGSAAPDTPVTVRVVPLPFPHAAADMAAVGPAFAGVGSVIAVSSGKGGVGKSTMAVNLAFALAAAGARVGLLDADIHGPSLPTMVQPPDTRVAKNDRGCINAVHWRGVSMMSYGWVAPVARGGSGHVKGRTGGVMRGPMVSNVLQQLVKFTEWGVVDHLVVDLPPGTGDVHLTLGQTVPISTSVIVTTPQRLAMADVMKGLDMFAALAVPTSGIVLNMAHFDAPDTGVRYHPFGDGEAAVRSMMAGFTIPTMYSLPIVPDLSTAGDAGTPFVLSHPTSPAAGVYAQLAAATAAAAETRVAAASGGGGGAATEGSEAAPSADGVTVKWAPEQGRIVVRHTTDQGSGQWLLHPREVRLACQCAACVDESTGQPRLNPATVPQSVVPVSTRPVGNYAVAVAWSDGHAASIYPHRWLLDLAKGGARGV
jgi:Mrp family chromosome partitioning ATPase/DUF971 family protein